MQHSYYTSILLQTAAEFLNSAYDTEMTSLLLVAVEQDQKSTNLLGIILIHEYDRPTSSNFYDCNCDPF